MLLLVLPLAAPAYPNGSPLCNAATAVAPQPGELDAMPLNLTCTQTECTLAAPKPFMGFVIGGAGPSISLPSNARRSGSNECITHSQRVSTSEISFSFTQSNIPRVIRATVVYSKQGSHLYAQAETVAPSTKEIVIIGGGPGGLGAARYLESIKQRYTLYERGPDMEQTFWQTPINTTEQQFRTFSPLGENTNLKLGQGIGGTQNVNGAVYAPGTPRDLANSLEIGISQARQAQEIAAGFIDTRTVVKTPDFVDVAMMWAPIDDNNPDDATLNTINQKMARRSLAYGFNPVYGTVKTESHAESVNDTHFKVNGSVYEHSGIILAAGALSSPQLLGHTEFTVINHAYREPKQVITSTERYTFDYPNADTNAGTLGSLEVMTAALQPGVSLAITMEMTTPYQTTVKVGENLNWGEKNNKLGGNEDPWHYMGTVKHTHMLVDGYSNVYIGDASALKRPFNCHTSMPAAAAGVLAAQRLMGLEMGTPEDIEAPYAARARMFVAGLWVLAVGISAHILGVVFDKQDVGRTVHYVCQPLGTVLITIAAAWSAIDDAPSSASVEHRILGWTTIALLWSNVLGGVYLKLADTYPVQIGNVHRAAGYIITALLAALAFTATVAGTGIDRIANAATFTAILGVLIIGGRGIPFWKKDKDKSVLTEKLNS